jgi:hypothetical protein
MIVRQHLKLDENGRDGLGIEPQQGRAFTAVGGVLGFADFAKRSAYEAEPNTPPAALTVHPIPLLHKKQN